MWLRGLELGSLLSLPVLRRNGCISLPYFCSPAWADLRHGRAQLSPRDASRASKADPWSVLPGKDAHIKSL